MSSSIKAEDEPLCNFELLKIKFHLKKNHNGTLYNLNERIIFCSLPKICKTDQKLKIIGICILKFDKLRQNMVKTALLVAVSTS